MMAARAVLPVRTTPENMVDDVPPCNLHPPASMIIAKSEPVLDTVPNGCPEDRNHAGIAPHAVARGVAGDSCERIYLSVKPVEQPAFVSRDRRGTAARSRRV